MYLQYGACLASFEIRYETAPILQLRKILNSENPQHAAMWHKFFPPQPEPSVAENAGGNRGNRGGGDGNVRVKRERNERAAGPAERIEIDLTVSNSVYPAAAPGMCASKL